MYLFVWVCFIPIYIFRHEQSATLQATSILVSSYGIIFCHFLPRGYVVGLLCTGFEGGKLDTTSTYSGVGTEIRRPYLPQGSDTPRSSTSTLDRAIGPSHPNWVRGVLYVAPTSNWLHVLTGAHTVIATIVPRRQQLLSASKAIHKQGWSYNINISTYKSLYVE